MKNKTRTLAAVVAMLLTATCVSAQTNNATADAEAKIVSAITIQNSRMLNFGSISPGASGGSVEVAATLASARTLTGANLTATNGATTSATFTVTGDGGATYAITRLPLANADLVLTNATSDQMTARLTVSTANAGGVESATGTISGSTGTDGTEVIYVGGVLTVGASQPAGTYTNNGGISLTVNYN